MKEKKIYILADMEGISGIRLPEQVQREGSSEYEQGRTLMMGDLNEAIAGCFDGGARSVVACDTHGGGGQVRLEAMDARAVYETPATGRLMPALDETFSGVILLGHHARAGTLNGFLDHTMSSAEWFCVTLNGVEVGEIGIEAAWAGHYGVPVIMVSGDAAVAAEARQTLSDAVECAVVKWGLGRKRARCLSLPVARAQIRETAARAVRAALAGDGRFPPYRPSLPATVEWTFNRSDAADAAALRPGIERVNARTVRRRIESLLDVHLW